MSHHRQGEAAFCAKHRKSVESCGWAERASLPSCLPSVHISLKVLSGRIHSLLDSHMGFLPVSTLVDCYDAHFPDQPLDQTGKPCVPLEHLISCIRGIEIRTELGAKTIQWTEKDEAAADTTVVTVVKSVSPRDTRRDRSGGPEVRSVDEGSRQLLSFSREVRGLLKHQPGCTIAFAKFVPAYHSHFGKQCCVQNYGFVKLIDLLQAIPHVVQILGDHKSLTLTHREQVRRFVSDLLRVLRSQPEQKKLLVPQLPAAFESFFGKAFCPSDYGVCFMDDLLTDVWEGAVILVPDQTKQSFVSVEIPRREQTPLQQSRTRYFAKEVIDLLKSMPNLSIPFSKFIPTYHHFFRRQCRLSDYGFQKLADLFEAMSPVTIDVKKRGPEDEDLICLSARIRAKVLCERMTSIMQNRQHCSLNRICEIYRQRYGHSLTPDDFASKRLTQLLHDFSRTGCVPAIRANYVRTIRTYMNCRKPSQPSGSAPHRPQRTSCMQMACQVPAPSFPTAENSPPTGPVPGKERPEKELESEVRPQSLRGEDAGDAGTAAAVSSKEKTSHKITRRLAIRFDSIP